MSAVVALGGQVSMGPAAYAQDPEWTPGHGGQPPRPVSGATPEHPAHQTNMPPMAGMPEHPALVDVGDAPPKQEGAPFPGAIDFGAQEPFDAAGLMGDLCQRGPGRPIQGAFNNLTGDFLTRPAFVREHGNFAPQGPWEILRGQCHFPVLGGWDHPGVTRRITAVHQNLGTGDDYYELTITWATAFDSSTSTGFSFSKTVTDELFSTTKSRSRDHSWAWGVGHEINRLRAMLIEPCTEVWLDATPIERTFRVQPVFEVFDHRFERNEERMSEDNWRVAGPGHPFIFAPGFHIDGTADRLLWDSTPDLIISKRQRNLDDKLCA
ncbi:hypothetical protein ACIBFB_24600 [Nocardiopsis sp. NPDC050513]|uniref:hypothetical protein n=1 Tax=Nocardiopsis sp. NPDC050513 TaxID=3364338 RepID=UPI0037A0E164